ncbi:hematopoietic SH2 domain-containing protein homolog isoform X1 [Clarias gariepinus]|uniref:hematopoietic SH2 domain-containing protein homolog isoform X1 n=1 Tax=Clarias gariepinus TaxID=13013 RepID=UPI00234DE5E2|nr:hematopoietic SH2 domain-containing protein homolog isoform X1 [Clarias gariepinus]
MANGVTPDAVIAWFTEYQNNHIEKDGVMPKWFHGNISRNCCTFYRHAEEMLMTKPPGYFLIRVSESRVGYTLSYRAKDLCRHFMIDMLPGNQCEIVGDNLQHCSLHDLVAFHCKSPIQPYTELLTVACDQAIQNTSEEMPPALPASHPSVTNQNLSTSLDGSVTPTRLYPVLEQELSALNFHSVESLPNSGSHPRQKCILTLPEIPIRWQSEPTKTTFKGAQSTSLPKACSQKKSEDTVPQKQAESKHIRINLIQCKKLFKKKKSHSEGQMYMEINEANVTTEPEVLQTVANEEDHQEEHCVSETIPLEYLNPPPFAPGY